MHEALELGQRAPIDFALEFDHGIERHPVVVPAPRVEFRALARAKRDVGIASDEPEQIPDLLLPAVASAPLALHPVMRHLVTQPVARASQDPDVLRLEPDFLVQLPVHCPFGRFTGVDAALRKLPRMFADPLAPKTWFFALTTTMATFGR
mgnify:CR=1 FL=1